jgi:hypothetical protein
MYIAQVMCECKRGFTTKYYPCCNVNKELTSLNHESHEFILGSGTVANKGHAYSIVKTRRYCVL